MTSVDQFNGLTDEAARPALQTCCSSDRWVSAVLAGRPYPSLAALLAASDAAVAAMTETDLLSALSGHPRLGALPKAPAASSANWSAEEQSEVEKADDDVRQALAAGNAEYERRFGHIYLACATGRGAAELLAFLRERLDNDREAEWAVVASELAKINQLRLGKLIGGTA